MKVRFKLIEVSLIAFGIMLFLLSGAGVSHAACPGGPDMDVDGVCDPIDNCSNTFNPNQWNANAGTNPGQDLCGNVCDSDFNQDLGIGLDDLFLVFKNMSFSGNPVYDCTDHNPFPAPARINLRDVICTWLNLGGNPCV